MDDAEWLCIGARAIRDELEKQQRRYMNRFAEDEDGKSEVNSIADHGNCDDGRLLEFNIDDPTNGELGEVVEWLLAQLESDLEREILRLRLEQHLTYLMIAKARNITKYEVEITMNKIKSLLTE
jgi:hypothetical protein